MARRQINAEEARRTLPELVQRASGGEIAIITHRGRPTAAIVPLKLLPPEREPEDICELRGSARGLYGDVGAYVEQLRGEWDERPR